MKLKIKIPLVNLSMSIIPMLGMACALYFMSIRSANEITQSKTESQLVSFRELQGAQISHYFETIGKQAETLADNLMVIDAAEQLSNAFHASDITLDPAHKNTLGTYYSQDFLTRYQEKNVGKTLDTNTLTQALNDQATYFQYHYIKANANVLGEKHKLDAANDNSRYSAIHSTVHPSLRHYLEAIGL